MHLSGGGIGTTIALWIVPEFTEFRKWKGIAIVWLGGAALADVVITSTLVWHLVGSATIPLSDTSYDNNSCFLLAAEEQNGDISYR